jgi:hypothetical protein
MSEETILLRRMLGTLKSIESELKKLNARAQ